MRTIIKIIIWLLVLFLIVFSATGIYISLFGKEMLITQLEEGLDMSVELEDISLKFPLSVNLKKLQIADAIKVKEISFTPILPALLSGRIVIDGLRLVDPSIELIKRRDGSLNFSLPEKKSGDSPSRLKVIVTGLKVENAKVSYLDQSISSRGVKTILNRLNLNISKTLFPINQINLKFGFASDISDRDVKKIGSLSGDGWVNLVNKSAQCKFSIEDLDISYFEPYYGDLISKRKLLSASLNLNSHAEAEDNDLKIDSQLRLSDLVYQVDDPDPESTMLDIGSIIGEALDLFIDQNGNLELDFTINTKLDHPKVEVKQIKKAVLTAALANLTGQPPERIIEKFESIVDRFKDFGEQMEGIFKGEDGE